MISTEARPAGAWRSTARDGEAARPPEQLARCSYDTPIQRGSGVDAYKTDSEEGDGASDKAVSRIILDEVVLVPIGQK
jgi:hypothetical protein